MSFDYEPIGRAEVRQWIDAFLFTQAVEIPIYVAAFTWQPRPRSDGTVRARPLWQRFVLAFTLSLVTHPIVWFVLPRLIESWTRMVIVAETWAVLGETVLLYLFGVRRPFLWSLAANAASCGLGLLSRYFLGTP